MASSKKRPSGATCQTSSPRKTSQTISRKKSQTASGFTLRIPPAQDLAAFAAIEGLCRTHAAALRARGLTPAVAAGAARLAGHLRETLAALGASDTPGPSRQELAPAIELVSRCRDGINGLLTGPGHLEDRRQFGIHQRLNPHSAASVRDACLAMADGPARAAAQHPFAALVDEADFAALRAHAAAIERSLGEREGQKKERLKALTARDVQHAALEKFYDWFAAAISMALPTGQERWMRSMRCRGERSGPRCVR